MLDQTNIGFFCGECKQEYPLIDGIYCFSNNTHDMTDFFPEDSFSGLYEAENTNFWFRVRNVIIGNALKKYLPTETKIMEIGCGTGFVSSYLIKIRYNVDCAELHLNPLVNSIFFYIFRLESYLLNYVDLPFGSSLLCIAQKKDD